MAKKYKGKQVFMESLVAAGVPYIFGNPGTTENPLLDSLLDYPRIEYIMALHESVATGMANYFSQATGIPGVVNLHVGPGLGNSLGMLYNAYEGKTPLIVTAGGQDTRMRLREPLLGHDLGNEGTVRRTKDGITDSVKSSEQSHMPDRKHV